MQRGTLPRVAVILQPRAPKTLGNGTPWREVGVSRVGPRPASTCKVRLGSPMGLGQLVPGRKTPHTATQWKQGQVPTEVCPFTRTPAGSMAGIGMAEWSFRFTSALGRHCFGWHAACGACGCRQMGHGAQQCTTAQRRREGSQSRQSRGWCPALVKGGSSYHIVNDWRCWLSQRSTSSILFASSGSPEFARGHHTFRTGSTSTWRRITPSTSRDGHPSVAWT